MAHFAKVENGIVTQVIVIDNEHEGNGEEFIHSLGLDGTWIQTSYNGNIRGKFAGIGDTYDEATDSFVSPVAEMTGEEVQQVIETPLELEASPAE